MNRLKMNLLIFSSRTSRRIWNCVLIRKCMQVWNIRFHCTFHPIPMLDRLTQSLSSLSWLSFSLNGERISLTESGSSSRFFLRKTRDRRIVSSFLWNYWPRFDGKGERGGFIQGRSFNFLQTNTEFFQESCLHRRQPCSENRLEEWFSVDRFDFSTFESFN